MRNQLYGGSKLSELAHPGFTIASILNQTVIHFCKSYPDESTTLCGKSNLYDRTPAEELSYTACGKCLKEIYRIRQEEYKNKGLPL